MSETDQTSMPSARVVRRRWPGLVWAVPVAALLVVGYLGLRAVFNRGIDVVVVFNGASGVSPGDTKVMEDGVEIGRVREEKIARDNRHVELTLRLDRRTRPALTDRAVFWMVGASPNIADIQSVKAAIAGVSIGMQPGVGGTPARRFTGLDQAPVIPPGTPGSAFALTAPALDGLTRGASIRYRGLEIGKVVSTDLDGIDRFRIGVWIKAPYDRFVHPGAIFWRAAPFKLRVSGSGISTQLGTPNALLQGEIRFDLPEAARATPRSPAGSVFPLFDDQAAAAQGAPGPQIPYAVTLGGAAGDIERGAAVSLLGYQVGEVRSTTLRFDAAGKPYSALEIGLYPRKFDVALADTDPIGAWRTATDMAVDRLLRRGYRIRLTQTPPLIGGHALAFAIDRSMPPALLIRSGAPYPSIPATAGGGPDVDAIIAQVNQILAKINRIPFDKIGHNLDGVADDLKHITAEARPKIGPLIDKLDATASQLDGAAASAHAMLSGQGAGQDQGLPDTIRQINETARTIRSFTDYLGRHPEALIRGKEKTK